MSVARPFRTLLVISLILLTAGCTGVEGDHPPFSWDRPFLGDRMRVPLSRLSEYSFRFHVCLPRGFGPAGIFVPRGKSRIDAMFFVYDTAPYGRLWVGEGLPDLNGRERRATYRDIASHPNAQSWRPIRVNDVVGLLAAPSGSPATVEWVDRNIQYNVLGPKLDSDGALSIARRVHADCQGI